MARLPRLFINGVAQHIVQRGNNRQVCFASDQDFAAYAYWLHEAAEKFNVAIHAWVFMTNHVRLLVTSSTEESTPLMMQHLGRLYVRYFNRDYRRSGTLWEGRYKSCLVQDEHYLLSCYRYIELNPVRADMVADPAQYRWSSYHANALDKFTTLITPHPEYLRLGLDEASRRESYRRMFQRRIDAPLITEVRDALNQGLVLENERFKDDVEIILRRKVRLGKPGPLRKNKQKCVDRWLRGQMLI